MVVTYSLFMKKCLKQKGRGRRKDITKNQSQMLWSRYFCIRLWRGYVILCEYYICIRLPAWCYSGSIIKSNEASREE